MRAALGLVSLSLLCAVAPLTLAGDHPNAKSPAPTAASPIATLGPTVGAAMPDAEVLTRTGDTVKLSSLVGKGPLVVIFYRGEWCPYCVKSLSGWNEKLAAFTDAGATVVAISPEKPGYAAELTNRQGLDYAVFADAKGEAARNFNVGYAVGDELNKKLMSYKIDLTERNSGGAMTLPHPATIVIDPKGMVQRVWVDPDYTKRVNPDEVLEAVKALPKA